MPLTGRPCLIPRKDTRTLGPVTVRLQGTWHAIFSLYYSMRCGLRVADNLDGVLNARCRQEVLGAGVPL